MMLPAIRAFVASSLLSGARCNDLCPEESSLLQLQTSKIMCGDTACTGTSVNFIATDGCPGANSAPLPDFEGSATAVANVQCCALDAGGAVEGFRASVFSSTTPSIWLACGEKQCGPHDAQACGALTAKTFAEAEQICRTEGKRVCTTDEVGACCSQGCGFDGDLVWATIAN